MKRKILTPAAAEKLELRLARKSAERARRLTRREQRAAKQSGGLRLFAHYGTDR